MTTLANGIFLDRDGDGYTGYADGVAVVHGSAGESCALALAEYHREWCASLGYTRQETETYMVEYNDVFPEITLENIEAEIEERYEHRI